MAMTLDCAMGESAMPSLHLDHVNIRTAHLDQCIYFYGHLLGMTMRPPPMCTDLTGGAYACDESGHPIVHLIGTDNFLPGNGPVRGAARLGMIDHFALRCTDPQTYIARLTEAEWPFERLEMPQIGRSLIFVREPNAVLVELSFPLDDHITPPPAPA